MAWRIELTDSALKALRRLDRPDVVRIQRFLRERIARSRNLRRLGKPLKGESRSYWRYRVGAYRLICHIEDRAVRILVVRVAHRKDVFRGR